MEKVLAIDFGTTHSYFTTCSKEETKPESVDFGKTIGIETVVLYRKGEMPLVGDLALEEYGMALPEERENYKISMQFKPEICTSEEAYKSTYDFLSGVLRIKDDLMTDISQVFIGVPCEASNEFREKIKKIAQGAGYGENIETKEEPKGALIYHIYNGDISAEEGLSGVLIIDFGGGTCDFAFMYNGEPQHSWGDMELGGRVFDDLFFQWFLEQNPKALKKIQEGHQEHFVLFYECREAKEHFSDIMAQTKREEKASALIRDYGTIRKMTWDDFLERANHYRPSPTFMKWMEMTKSNPKLYQKGAQKQTIDLIEWFKTALEEGIRQYGLQNKIHLVILAGGSSKWVWVKDVVFEVLGHNVKVIQSNRPYAVISEGLSVLPALQKRHMEVQRKVKKEMPVFLDQELMPLIKEEFDEFNSDIARSISTKLYHKIYPDFQKFINEKSSIASLKETLACSIKEFEPELKRMLREKTLFFKEALSAKINDKIRNWFSRYKLFLPKQEIIVSEPSNLNAIEAVDPSLDILGWISAALMATITASICGGSGMALIASGPIGLFIGAVLGGIAGLIMKQFSKELGIKDLQKWLTEKTGFEEIDLSPWVKKVIFSKSKVSKLQEDIEDYLKEEITKKLKEEQKRIKEGFEQHINKAIDALSEINQI
ncbi:MAG TPA: hypothetical protein ENI35_05665 [Candidatus Desulfofervidus auxilii]|uniref:Uncharacterized protein n=1 Tax=Desulfofervidus auxilii TaxID=1621989 RepID=A0A7C2A8W0_DESA2|nr:hypothetical protein [Candidatus Desulfofervidus auxilii]